MSDVSLTYTTKVSGLWNSRAELSDDSGPIGVLTWKRNALGMVTEGEYRPEKGEVLSFRRDPGILRSQFSVWTDGGEWLGSSLRRNFLKREVHVFNGGKPFRMVPTRGFQRGWVVYAPKTGETVKIDVPLVGRGAKIQVQRRIDFPLVVFLYFLGAQLYWESVLPGPSGESVMEKTEQTTV